MRRSGRSAGQVSSSAGLPPLAANASARPASCSSATSAEPGSALKSPITTVAGRPAARSTCGELGQPDPGAVQPLDVVEVGHDHPEPPPTPQVELDPQGAAAHDASRGSRTTSPATIG